MKSNKKQIKEHVIYKECMYWGCKYTVVRTEKTTDHDNVISTKTIYYCEDCKEHN